MQQAIKRAVPFYDPQAYLKAPKYVGRTYTEVKAERQAKRRRVISWIMLAVWVGALLLAGYYLVMG